ncbi:MAG: hypothetical protein M0P64_04610 [Candidatus Pacebacteria bacterium]|jgi:hypothetical protein|nr:hypothetical protein [Candidatus Paceibacterota bacterium]
MRTFSIHQVRNVLIAIAVVVLIGATYLASSTPLRAPSAEAGSGENITGWAWSENVGWISLNSTTDGSATSYGVSVDVTGKATGSTGDFSGYAWSENVGWISFNRSDAGNPPAAPFNGGVGTIAQVDWSTGNVTGWAKVLSTNGGWDGWIKLSDDTVGVWSGKGVKIVGNKFTGMAWGSTVMGWIDFAPTVNGIPLGTEVSAPPCTATYGAPEATWGSCQAVATCDSVTYLPGQTYTNLPGVSVGICNIGGGTTVESCGSIATLVCPDAPAATKTRWWQF